MSRRYNPEWEATWPWLTKVMGINEISGEQAEERAYCIWCKVEMEPHTSRIITHESSEVHMRNAGLVAAQARSVEQDLTKPKQEHVQGEQEDQEGDSPQDMALKRPRVIPKKNFESDMIPTPTIFDMLHDPGNPATNGYERSMEPPPPPPPPAQQERIAADDSGEGSINMSLPVVESVKSMGVEVKVLADGGETVPLEKCLDLKMEAPSNGAIPMCTLKANAQQPDWYEQQLCHALTTGVCYDALWLCDGGMFRVHKFVLAAFSPEFKAILPDSELEAAIFTPELSMEMVKAMLSIIYGGQAKVSWKIMQDINNGFKLIGFGGKDLTAISQDMAEVDEVVMTYSNSRPQYGEDVKFGPTEMTHSVFRGKPDPDTFDGSRLKQEPKKVIKIEMEEEGHYMEPSYYDDENIEPEPKRFKSHRGRRKKWMKREMDVLYDKSINDNEIDKPFEDVQYNEDGTIKRKRGRPKGSGTKHLLDKLDTRETRTTYPLFGKGRGLLSKRLAYDLFDDDQFAKSVKSISICPVCFKLFDEREKMRDHKIMSHDLDVKGVPNQNSMILGKNTFQCKKCEQTLELKHLVWFVKHYKFCGTDDTKAAEIVGIDDVEEPESESPEKKNNRDSDIMYVTDKPKLMDISRTLIGRVVGTIWGCRKCYEAFETEEEYTEHINTAHEGKIEHGTCYDPEAKIYSCKNCKVFKTSKSVHYFIYHIKKCTVDAQGIVPIDDEEDVDEDTYYEFIDPWGIVNRPLKIRTQRSKWICESLFGQLYGMLFPCHLCYNVFKSDEEVREHFRITHPGLQNFMEHGDHYNKETGGFMCPVCKREVCKKQRNSIYFTYHMRKCSNKVYAVTRTCTACQKNFSSFRTYQYHVQSKCGTSETICHICGMVLKTAASLQKHVMVGHSDARPFPCKVCNKTFKRAPDLDHHMKLHMGSLDWSCDKCGKAFPVKKALKHHMKSHLTEAEKPHVCHICGNRFAQKKFLTNHITTHSSFRGFACEVCNAQVKTRDSLKQHRKKVHRLFTPIPPSCILKPEGRDLDLLMPKNKLNRNPAHRKRHHLPSALVQAQIKEEVLPILGEELELP